MNIAVLASTNATDMQVLIDEIGKGRLSANLFLIVNKDCGAIDRAKKHGIPYWLVPSKGKEREAFDKEFSAVIDEHHCELILCIGYMRFLSPWFVKKYRNKIMNIHPSLLPEFAGGMDTNVHGEVLKSGVKKTGCTLHFVDEGADTGPIIMQKEVPVEEGETVDSLKAKVQKAEQEIILKAVKKFIDGKITVKGDRVHIAP